MATASAAKAKPKRTKKAAKKPKKKDMRALVEELFASLEDQPKAERIMDEVYDANMYFLDPIQRVDGLENFKKMNDQVTGSVKDVSFTLIGITGDGKDLCTEWVMNFKFLGRRVALPGVSWLGFNEAGKCYRHVDYWDWIGLLAQVIPGLSGVGNILKKVVG